MIIGSLLGTTYFRAVAREAAEERRKLRLLSDEKLVYDLTQQMDELWPAHPSLIPQLSAWIRDVQGLTRRQVEHEAVLEDIAAIARKDGELTSELLWQGQLLANLICELDRLKSELLSADATDSQYGWSIASRLAAAEHIRDGFTPGGQYDQTWRRDLSALGTAYPGLTLSPIVGLLPLGPDPASGLWEFAHLMTGEPAHRSPDGSLQVTPETGIVLVLLPGGSFSMGAQGDPTGPNYYEAAKGDEGPVHEVTLQPFFISKYEMTQGQWLRLTGYNPSAYGLSAGSIWDPDWLASGSGPTLLHPVELVSWNECLSWLERAALTLPTEAQWEYAARATTTTPWWTGETKESLDEAENLSDIHVRDHRVGTGWSRHLDFNDGASAHAPVGSYRPNAFGIHDILGNVSEWCFDSYDFDFYSTPPSQDPVSDLQEAGAPRVYRGGAYTSTEFRARSSVRFGASADGSDDDIGVRPAMRVPVPND